MKNYKFKGKKNEKWMTTDRTLKKNKKPRDKCAVASSLQINCLPAMLKLLTDISAI